jgi:hypothetical protein
VFIYGCKEDGDPFQELTRTLAVDVRGGLIELESPVVNGLRVLATVDHGRHTRTPQSKSAADGSLSRISACCKFLAGSK